VSIHSKNKATLLKLKVDSPKSEAKNSELKYRIAKS